MTTEASGLAGELAPAIVGSLFVAIGAAAVGASFCARPRRELSLLWFGVFAALYGVRLMSESALIHAVTPWPDALAPWVEAFITYVILVPGGLFIEALVGPGWHRSVRRMWQATCLCAIGAVANDLAQGGAGASMWLNPPLVLSNVVVWSGHVLARTRGARSIEGRVVAAATALFVLVALYETFGLRGSFGEALDAEPLAMLLLTIALGWFVLARTRERTYAFVALSRELELARTIQQSLLPREMPAVPGLRIETAYLPMSAVAGDFYDLVLLPDGRPVLIVADVSGHGVPAALVASMVKVAFAAESERYDRPGDILSGINRALTGKFERTYVTACCVAVDHVRGIVAYAAAGHPPAILRRRDGSIARLQEGGVALALFPAVEYATTEVPFHPGDRLLVFTDGLTEAPRRRDDAFFGDSELERVVAALPPAETTHRVLDAHRAWIGDAPLTDDVTLVVVERLQS